MAAGRHLPDLSTLVRGRQRRRGRGSRGDHRAARPPRRRCTVEAIWLSPIFTSPMADFGYDVSDYCDVDPVFGTLARPRRADRRLPRARHQARARLGAQPQLRPAPVVRRVALQPREPQARLVRLARRAATTGRRCSRPSARRGRSTRRRGQYYLHSFMRRAARPQLGQPRGRGRDARRAALLDGPRRRRPAPGRDRQDRQGPAAARPRAARPRATTRTGSRSTRTCAASARSSTNTTTG